MYLAHFGLREPPFSITPDPRFVCLSERHRDALAHLLYGIGQGGGSGFVQLTGEVGTGKTTLSRLLLEQLPDNVRVALILNPLLSPTELLEATCEELRIGIDGLRGNLKALVDALNAHLLEAHAAGLRVVLLIDEAQDLSPAALEQVRLLTNLETATQKLLQIILIGQPELREQLARPELRQLAQRITARYHLDPLDAGESGAYLRHRWAVAGGGAFPFTAKAVRRLHRHAGGIARLLNVIADRALLAGYARGERVVGDRLVDLAASEVLAPGPRARGWLPLIAAAAMLAAVAALAFAPWRHGAANASKAAPVVRHPAIVSRASAPARPVRSGAGTASAARVRAIAPPIDDEQFANRLATSRADPRSAWAALRALWELQPEAVEASATAACPAMHEPGLVCASGHQRLGLLALFDRPVLLRLRTRDHAAWAVLLGLGSTQALVETDGVAATVHRSALEDAMDGYAALGRAPREVVVPLKRGDSGAGVGWLRQRLLGRQVDGPQPALFDEALVAAVRSAQRAVGLRPDGVVGPETLLALLAGDAAGPHLKRLPE